MLTKFDMQLIDSLIKITPNIIQGVRQNADLLNNAKLVQYLAKRKQLIPKWFARQVADDIKYQDQQQWAEEVG